MAWSRLGSKARSRQVQLLGFGSRMDCEERAIAPQVIDILSAQEANIHASRPQNSRLLEVRAK